MWSIINEDAFKNVAELLFGCFNTFEIPSQLLQNYGCEYHQKLINTIGLSNLQKLNTGGKCPNGFLVFLQTVTGTMHEGQCPIPTCLKTLNLAMHDRI